MKTMPPSAGWKFNVTVSVKTLFSGQLWRGLTKTKKRPKRRKLQRRNVSSSGGGDNNCETSHNSSSAASKTRARLESGFTNSVQLNFNELFQRSSTFHFMQNERFAFACLAAAGSRPSSNIAPNRFYLSFFPSLLMLSPFQYWREFY